LPWGGVVKGEGVGKAPAVQASRFGWAAPGAPGPGAIARPFGYARRAKRRGGAIARSIARHAPRESMAS